MPKGPNGQKRPTDGNQLAKMIADLATGDVSEATNMRDSAKADLSRKGGAKGGIVRAARLTPEQRSEAAKLAAQARWRRNED
ncbi:MAG: hypothetical protein CGW95_12935 [Phenylobacterium zucineum]|nr:MAG: hypothetical protein CGW95_12935 [Phenylobacterium zucineum]